MKMMLAAMAVMLSACGAPPCAFETMCGCYARGDECVMHMDGCFCNDQCGMDVYCICGGGKYLGCTDR